MNNNKKDGRIIMDNNLYLVNQDENLNFFYIDLNGKRTTEENRIKICSLNEIKNYTEYSLFNRIDGKTPIATKRMGFTPKTQLSEGNIGFINIATLNNANNKILSDKDINTFTNVECFNHLSSEKTKYINKGDILVSFKHNIGITRIFNADIPCISNEAIDIISVDTSRFNTNYIATQLPELYQANAIQHSICETLNNEAKDNITLLIPKPICVGRFIFSSIQLQMAIAFQEQNKEIIKQRKLKIIDTLIDLNEENFQETFKEDFQETL